MNQLYASIAILIYNLMEPISWNWTLISDQLTFACYSVPPPPSFSLSLSLSLFLSPFLCMSVCVCVCVYPWRRVSVCVCVYMCVNMPQYIYEASLIELGFSRFAAAVTSGAPQKHSDQLLSFLAWSFVPDSDRNCVSTVPFRVRLCVCVFGFSTGRGEEGNFVWFRFFFSF